MTQKGPLSDSLIPEGLHEINRLFVDFRLFRHVFSEQVTDKSGTSVQPSWLAEHVKWSSSSY